MTAWSSDRDVRHRPGGRRGAGLRRLADACSPGRPWWSRSSRSTSRRRAPMHSRPPSRTPPSAPTKVDPAWVTGHGAQGRHPGARRTRLRQRAAVGAPTAARSAGRPWPASAGSSRSTAPSAAGRSPTTGTPRRRCSGPALDGEGDVRRDPGDGREREPGTATRRGTTRSVRCSSSRPRGRPGAPTATATAAPTPTTSTTRPHAAARYLCADGHDLTTGAGWADAVFGYNHAAELRQRGLRRRDGVRRADRLAVPGHQVGRRRLIGWESVECAVATLSVVVLEPGRKGCGAVVVAEVDAPVGPLGEQSPVESLDLSVLPGQ